jgi:hypothetical protein
MSSKPRFYQHHVGDIVVIYQIKTVKEEEPKDDTHCPYCGETMSPLADILQYGIFDDAYHTFFACEPCGVAVEFRYNIATYALVSKRDQKQTGTLLPSK